MVRWQKLATLLVLAALVVVPFALVPFASPATAPSAAARTAAVIRRALDRDRARQDRAAGRRISRRRRDAGPHRRSAGAGRATRCRRAICWCGSTIRNWLARIAAAAADVALKKFARDEQSPSGALKRRYDADDAVFAAEQRQIDGARSRSTASRAAASRGGNDDDVAEARAQLQSAEAEVTRARAAAADVRASQGTPDPNANETALIVARSQLAALQAMLDQTRIRAPIDGTVMSSVGQGRRNRRAIGAGTADDRRRSVAAARARGSRWPRSRQGAQRSARRRARRCVQQHGICRPRDVDRAGTDAGQAVAARSAPARRYRRAGSVCRARRRAAAAAGAAGRRLFRRGSEPRRTAKSSE